MDTERRDKVLDHLLDVVKFPAGAREALELVYEAGMTHAQDDELTLRTKINIARANAEADAVDAIKTGRPHTASMMHPVPGALA